MASYDAGTLTNESKRSAKIFKDLNLDFQQNSATKDMRQSTVLEIYTIGFPKARQRTRFLPYHRIKLGIY